VTTRPATLLDVARAAGVHVSTVSRVLTGSPDLTIRAETRTRIEQAAADLRYRPNALARGLRMASTGALGMLVPSLRNPVYSEIIRGAFERAWERDVVVVLAEDRGGGDAERAYERLVEQGRIDGLLIAGVRPGSLLPEHAERAPVPFVFVNRRHPGGHNVSMREEEAAAVATGHLLELGHRRLGHLAGPEDVDTARRRLAGFLEAAGDAPRVVHAEFDERAGHRAMRELLDGAEAPTGVFASNLNQAIGALAAARDAGLRVPEDVSLVTYDDDPLSDFLEPPLTGIRMPLHELGIAAVEAMLGRIAGEPPADVTVPAPPELVVRRSTAPPPRTPSRRGGSSGRARRG
jgi:DNA-binding LacI/PurR family transcriptional regulator